MPASTTTFGDVVNSVLRACGEPEVDSSSFAATTGNAKRVKYIVIETFGELRVKTPEVFWHTSAEITLRAPFSKQTIGIENTTVTFSLNLGLPTDFVPKLSMYNLVNESDWYRVSAHTAPSAEITLAKSHITYITGNPYSSAGSPSTIYQFAQQLPADFMDFVDVAKPFEGYDISPVSPIEFWKIASGSPSAFSDLVPRRYCVFWDGSVGASADGPFIGFWPPPNRDMYMQLRYTRRPTALAITDAATVKVDLPEDLIPILKARSKVIAKMEIQGDAQGASVYRDHEVDVSREYSSKQIANERPRIVPNMDPYRGHARRAHSKSTRLWRSGR